jgi:hypothetical protein
MAQEEASGAQPEEVRQRVQESYESHAENFDHCAPNDGLGSQGERVKRAAVPAHVMWTVVASAFQARLRFAPSACRVEHTRVPTNHVAVSRRWLL